MLSPKLAIAYMKAYDRATALQGGKRNVCKTIVTIYATEQQRLALQANWGLEELATMCTVQSPTASGKTLGIALGGPQSRIADFNAKIDVVQCMHDKLRTMGHTATELVLSQACLGVAKVSHYLRASGMSWPSLQTCPRLR